MTDGRRHVLQECIQEVVRRCAIEAEKRVRHVVDKMYWRHTLWMADLRTVVIGNISLDCNVEGDEVHAWCAHGFGFNIV